MTTTVDPRARKPSPDAARALPDPAKAVRRADAMTDAPNELQELIRRHAPRLDRDDGADASRLSVLPGVRLWAVRAPLGPTPSMFEPMLYFALQGAKRLSTGDRTVEYGAGSMFLASLDVPVTWTVTDATPDRPYLAVALDLDPAAIAAMLLELPPPTEAELTEEVEALALATATDAMHDPLRRLLRLLDAPADAPLLAPMFERELLYRVLQSPRGVILRQIARTGSRLSQIQR
ncbi:MAG: AraC family transcriptional regulator, partial [Myxococcales bacterium]